MESEKLVTSNHRRLLKHGKAQVLRRASGDTVFDWMWIGQVHQSWDASGKVCQLMKLWLL
jgi:hypothetical protein